MNYIFVASNFIQYLSDIQTMQVFSGWMSYIIKRIRGSPGGGHLGELNRIFRPPGEIDVVSSPFQEGMLIVVVIVENCPFLIA